MNALRRSFVAAALAWAALLLLATYAASRAHLDAIAAAMTVVVYAVGAVVCHQLPVRSFHLWGAQMPVCARCTGIYLGAAVGAAIARLKPSSATPGVRRRIRGADARLLAVVAVAPSAATLVFEWTTGVMPPNAIRFVAGVWLGSILAALVVAASTSPKREVN